MSTTTGAPSSSAATTSSANSNALSWNDIVLIFGIIGSILLLIALLLVGTGASISIGVFLCLIFASVSGAVAVGLTVTYLNDGTTDYTMKLAASTILLVLGILLAIGLYGWFGWKQNTKELVGGMKSLPHKLHRTGYEKEKRKAEKRMKKMKSSKSGKRKY